MVMVPKLQILFEKWFLNGRVQAKDLGNVQGGSCQRRGARYVVEDSVRDMRPWLPALLCDVVVKVGKVLGVKDGFCAINCVDLTCEQL